MASTQLFNQHSSSAAHDLPNIARMLDYAVIPRANYSDALSPPRRRYR